MNARASRRRLSSGSTRRPSSRGRGSGLRPCAGSSSATAGACGRSPRRDKERASSSPSHPTNHPGRQDRYEQDASHPPRRSAAGRIPRSAGAVGTRARPGVARPRAPLRYSRSRRILFSPQRNRGEHSGCGKGSGVICRTRTGTCGLTFRRAAFTPRSPLNGCPGRSRTCTPRGNSAPLSRLSYWTMGWYRPADSNGAPLAYRASALASELDQQCWRGRLDSNQGHPTSEAGVLPLNYAPSVWRFPPVTIRALRFFRPALSPDQLEKR